MRSFIQIHATMDEDLMGQKDGKMEGRAKEETLNVHVPFYDGEGGGGGYKILWIPWRE